MTVRVPSFLWTLPPLTGASMASAPCWENRSAIEVMTRGLIVLVSM